MIESVIQSVLDRCGVVILATILVGVPLGALAAVVAARLRIRAGLAPRTAWRSSVSEAGAAVGTVPWLWMILTPAQGPGGLQLVPGADLRDVLSGGDAVVQSVGNLLAFAALGFFLPIRLRLGAPWTVPGAVALVVAGASTLVELLQHVLELGRVSSVDDVILNVAGAVLASLASLRWWRARLPAVRERAADGDPGPRSAVGGSP